MGRKPTGRRFRPVAGGVQRKEYVQKPAIEIQPASWKQPNLFEEKHHGVSCRVMLSSNGARSQPKVLHVGLTDIKNEFLSEYLPGISWGYIMVVRIKRNERWEIMCFFRKNIRTYAASSTSSTRRRIHELIRQRWCCIGVYVITIRRSNW